MALGGSNDQTISEPALGALAALSRLYESTDRLVDAVESLLDDDAREGADMTEEAWLHARDGVLAQARDTALALDDPAVLAALRY